MNAHWQAHLGAQGARIDENSVRDFGAPESELIAARQASVAAPLTAFALIECAGADAETFLHNQLSSDVKRLSPTGAQYATWCSPKGRMLASFLLFRHGASYRMIVSDDLLEFVLKRLPIYVLRSKVTLTHCGHEILGLSGPKTATALQAAGLELPVAALTLSQSDETSVIRLDEQRSLVVAAHDAVIPLWQRLCATVAPVGAPVWQWLDIEAGIPWIRKATQEAFVPQMAGFDRIGAVSFSKGCYPGQEIIARTKYLGKPKRHLYRVHADGQTPISAGMPVFPGRTPDQSCGQIASAAPAPHGGHDALVVILEEAACQAELWAAWPDGGSVRLSTPDPVFSAV